MSTPRSIRSVGAASVLVAACLGGLAGRAPGQTPAASVPETKNLTAR